MQNPRYRSSVFKVTASALLIAIGILIPMVSPIRVIIEPASFTLASHVAIFIAMFISPAVAVAVTFGTTLGFFLGGFPLIIVIRAASHVIFVIAGSLYLQRIDKFNISVIHLRIFSLAVALIHALFELIGVLLFYFGTNVPVDSSLFLWALGFVGLGTVIHSVVDMEIANIVRLALQKQRHFKELAR